VPNAYCKAGPGSEDAGSGVEYPSAADRFGRTLPRLDEVAPGRFELHELNENYWVDGHILHNPHSEEYWKLRA
jgi:hypothetical protein